MKVYVKTLGCKVNSYDSHALENQFVDLGFALASNVEEADLAIVNTCSVTANAEKEARYLARRFKRTNPQSLVALAGCYAQTNSVQLSELADVDFIFPNEIKHEIASLVAEIAKGDLSHFNGKFPAKIKPVKDNRQTHFKSSITLFDKAKSSRTRAFLKIQDGCNGFCTYCLIPYARGASRSVPEKQVLREVHDLLAMGSQEIVLTGIHLGDYGGEHPEGSPDRTSFAVILKEILKIPELKRLRISSLEPSELCRELIEVMAAYKDKMCDHFHLPLQSGSDRILKLMRRTYSAHEYAEAVKMLRNVFPRANIGADVIPGFPSETDEDHRITTDFIRVTGLNYLHVFPYSKRPNTAAMKMPGHLDPRIVARRASELRDLSKELISSYQRPFVGTTLRVLWESDRDGAGRLKGHSQNFLPVVCSSQAQPQAGQISLVELKGFTTQNTFLGLPLQLC